MYWPRFLEPTMTPAFDQRSFSTLIVCRGVFSTFGMA